MIQLLESCKRKLGADRKNKSISQRLCKTLTEDIQLRKYTNVLSNLVKYMLIIQDLSVKMAVFIM